MAVLAILVQELLVFDRTSLGSWPLSVITIGGEKLAQWDLTFLGLFHSYMEALAAA